jgi:hypothetical protein
VMGIGFVGGFIGGVVEAVWNILKEYLGNQ